MPVLETAQEEPPSLESTNLPLPLDKLLITLRDFQPICAVYPSFRSTTTGEDGIVEVSCLNCNTIVLTFSAIQKDKCLVQPQNQCHMSASQLWLEPLLPTNTKVLISRSLMHGDQIEQAKLDPYYSPAFHIIVKPASLLPSKPTTGTSDLSPTSPSYLTVSTQLNDELLKYIASRRIDAEARIATIRETVYAELEQQEMTASSQKEEMLHRLGLSLAPGSSSKGLPLSPFMQQPLPYNFVPIPSDAPDISSKSKQGTIALDSQSISQGIDFSKESDFANTSTILSKVPLTVPLALDTPSQTTEAALLDDYDNVTVISESRAPNMTVIPESDSISGLPPLPDTADTYHNELLESADSNTEDDQDEVLFEMEGMASRPTTKYSITSGSGSSALHYDYQWRYRNQAPSGLSMSLPIRTPNFARRSDPNLGAIAEEKAVAGFALLESEEMDTASGDQSALPAIFSRRTLLQGKNDVDAVLDEGESEDNDDLDNVGFEPPHIVSARTYARESFLGSRPFSRKFSAI
ncbi:hypothetical protein BSLG_007262 [Batrachochytrium salamandrivorans]|nr:hypothetical protein BASA60_005212 [Batrachochytrium salamandrivorans]KAJ1336478.1 hypothetical protein BSLG_007262 [Batrachochytrium salamandrivorans]